MNRIERIDLAEWVVESAKKYGADQVAVSISNSRNIEIEFRDKQLDKLMESTRNSLSLQLYVNQRYSSHSTNDLKKNSLDLFIREAVASTKYLTPDEYRRLPDPKYYPENVEGDLEICDQTYGAIESTSRVQMAAEIEAEAMAQSDKIISTTSGYSDTFGESVRLHSNGFLGERESTRFSAWAEVTVKDEDRGRPEDWFEAVTRFQKDLPSPEIIGRNAAERALRKIGQSKMDSGQYDMIVENRAGRTLIEVLLDPMTAEYLQQKNSYLENMIDKKIASESFTLIDDPFIQKGLGSRFFDEEGIASEKRIMIEKGILKKYFLDNYYGRKLGMEPNSGTQSNLVFEYGSKSMEEMIKELNKGIVITGFIGGNSNSTTGDFSFGIFGLLVERGSVVRAVNEMNISGNAKTFWNQLVAMGNDPYPYSSWQVPSMLFEGVQFSGV
ncbi:TldD/PmbA family protein [bacterium]|nr:TldD/PmbA family protein [bacterium]